MKSTKTYRADFPAWVLFVGLALLIGLFMGLGGALWQGLAVVLLTVVWLLGMSITVTEEELAFTSMFITRSIRKKDIKSVQFVFQFRAAKGPFRLIVEPLDGNQSNRLEINAKFFSRDAINTVLSLAPEGQANDHGLRKLLWK